jgi:hypothetical protein
MASNFGQDIVRDALLLDPVLELPECVYCNQEVSLGCSKDVHIGNAEFYAPPRRRRSLVVHVDELPRTESRRSRLHVHSRQV